MELAFQKSAVTHLQKLLRQVQSQEETMETAVPESLPDVGRIVSSWGIPVIRSKEWRGNTMTVSGGITAWVLYVPEDESLPRQISTYLPFSMRWELPQTEKEGTMRVSCHLKSVDARMVSPRKILVRANVSCLGEAFSTAETTFYTLPEVPKEVEILSSHLPLLLPSEMAEKSFLLDEELELPGGASAVSQIIAYQLSPILTDHKVLGEKALMKGNCGLHLVYMTPEDRLAVWDFELPFSQYTELGQHYDEEEELQAELILTGAEIIPDEDGRRLRLKCSLSAQCMVLQRQMVEVIQDMYCLNRDITLKSQSMPVKSRLDHQILREQVEESFSLTGGSLLDCTLLPEFPKSHRNGKELSLEAPVWCNILYYDAAGSLQGRSSHTCAKSKINLAEDCVCQADAHLSGPVQWSLGGGSASVRASVELCVDSFANQELSMVCGAELSPPKKPDPTRPSLILRAPKEGETIWSMAKASGSTVDSIREANQLTTDSLEECPLVLIPIH